MQRTPPGHKAPVDPPQREDLQEEAAAATRALAEAEAESARLTVAKAEAERLKRRKAREEARARQEAQADEIARAVEESEAEEEERAEAVRKDRRVATSSNPKAKKPLANKKTLAVKTRGTGEKQARQTALRPGSEFVGLCRTHRAGQAQPAKQADRRQLTRPPRDATAGPVRLASRGLPPPGPPLYTEGVQGGEDPQFGGSARGGSTTVSAPLSAEGGDHELSHRAGAGERQPTTADLRQLTRQHTQVEVHQTQGGVS